MSVRSGATGGGSGSWMDRNWFWLVISFGAICVAAIDFCDSVLIDGRKVAALLRCLADRPARREASFLTGFIGCAFWQGGAGSG